MNGLAALDKIPYQGNFDAEIAILSLQRRSLFRKCPINSNTCLGLTPRNPIMKNEGIYDTETIMNLPPHKFKDFFGADAVMYIWIKRWSTSYYIVGGNVSVSIRSVLRSTTTGDDLWQYEGTIVEDTTITSSGGGLGGLAVAIIATAVKTAATDYVPIAKRANYMIINTIPYGEHNPSHEKDREQKVIIEKVMKTRR